MYICNRVNNNNYMYMYSTHVVHVYKYIVHVHVNNYDCKKHTQYTHVLYTHTVPLTIELDDGLKVRKLNVEKFLLCTREYGFLKFRTPELKTKIQLTRTNKVCSFAHHKF